MKEGALRFDDGPKNLLSKLPKIGGGSCNKSSEGSIHGDDMFGME